MDILISAEPELNDRKRTTQPSEHEIAEVKVVPSTKRGDRGRTSLLSGERVSKSSLRIEACGNLDETNAAMGLAKAFATNEKIRGIIETIQKHLVFLGAELSNTDPARQFQRIEPDQIAYVEKWIQDLQLEVPLSRQFVDPGHNPVSAALHMARAIARRSERSIVALQESGEATRQEVMSYINRLGCLLFTLAHYSAKMC
jgi:cob(I)alamin adenosyltransferase